MTKRRTPEIIFQPSTYQALQKGIDQIVAAIRPTLGPLPRMVAITPQLTHKLPEVLDNGGLISRRILQLPDPDADVGAMMVRHLLWQLYEGVGDGTATAAVLFQSIYRQGVTYLAAGGNAMRLRHYLEQGLALILAQLSAMTVHVEGKENLARVAESICFDPALARLLGEIFDIIGEYGRLEIRAGQGRELDRDYVEGMYWERTVVSREMFTDQARLRAELEEAALLMSDLDMEDPHQLLPVFKEVIQAGIRTLLLVGDKFSPEVIALLLSNKQHDKFQVIAVTTPGFSLSEKAESLQDLAILTGGRPVLKAAGQSLGHVRLADLGRARRVWANVSNFGIIGGKGDPRLLRQHLADLRARFARMEAGQDREKLRQRIGKLVGGSANLRIGGISPTEIEQRKALAERTAQAVRGAILEGVVPGGGMALLACQPALRAMEQSPDLDERTAYRILARALEAPLRTILDNAGYDPSEVMAEIRAAGPDHGFDVLTGQVVHRNQAGIYDVATVTKAAVRGAVTTAALALTVDVLVHRRNSDKSLKP